MNINQKGGLANHCNLDVLSDMLFISKQATINHSKSFQLWREGLKIWHVFDLTSVKPPHLGISNAPDSNVFKLANCVPSLFI